MHVTVLYNNLWIENEGNTEPVSKAFGLHWVVNAVTLFKSGQYWLYCMMIQKM